MNDMKIGKVKHMVPIPILIFRCYEPGSCTGTVYIKNLTYLNVSVKNAEQISRRYALNVCYS